MLITFILLAIYFLKKINLDNFFFKSNNIIILEEINLSKNTEDL